MRRFNTAGPCDASLHYLVPPEERLPEARRLIEEGAYFVVHAPRQTGKTTTLRALSRSLTRAGEHAALSFSCEAAEPAGDDFGLAEEIVLQMLRSQATRDLPADLQPPTPWPDAARGSRLHAGLASWSLACPRPLVLFFDEIDALRGESLGASSASSGRGSPSGRRRFRPPSSCVVSATCATTGRRRGAIRTGSARRARST